MATQLTEDEIQVLRDQLTNEVHLIKMRHHVAGTLGSNSRSDTMVHRGYKAASTVLSVAQPDGRSRVYIIEAILDGRGVVRTETKALWDEHESFWNERLKRDPDRILIVNHKVYTLGEETRDEKGQLQRGGGFGGRLIRFRRFLEVTDDGSTAVLGGVEETRNLWFSGVLPPTYRAAHPDNAEFLGDFDGPVQV